MIKVNEKARKIDADRLISIAGVIERKGCSVYYHFSKNTDPKIREMKITVPEGETVESMIPIYANAQLLEAEVTEMQGVKFEGNPSSGKRLFLEEK